MEKDELAEAVGVSGGLALFLTWVQCVFYTSIVCPNRYLSVGEDLFWPLSVTFGIVVSILLLLAFRSRDSCGGGGFACK